MMFIRSLEEGLPLIMLFYGSLILSYSVIIDGIELVIVALQTGILFLLATIIVYSYYYVRWRNNDDNER